MAVELDVEALTPNQAARRQRVIDAAMKLAADGGYDTVQMRDVASEAGVALGTIYRYFASKDHLLAACQVAFARAEQRRLELRPTQGDTAADRVVDVLRRATRAQERQPLLTAAMVTAISPHAAERCGPMPVRARCCRAPWARATSTSSTRAGACSRFR